MFVSLFYKLCTLPPIGLADHDIVYAEIDTWLKRVRETPRKVMKYKEANWDNLVLSFRVGLSVT
jgi:hypothetical protein